MRKTLGSESYNIYISRNWIGHEAGEQEPEPLFIYIYTLQVAITTRYTQVEIIILQPYMYLSICTYMYV